MSSKQSRGDHKWKLLTNHSGNNRDYAPCTAIGCAAQDKDAALTSVQLLVAMCMLRR